MKTSPEPIILTVALVLLILAAAGLAFTFPSLQDITGVSSTSPTGHTPPRMSESDLEEQLSDWAKPAEWNGPENKHRLFISDGFLFYPSLYPDGNYLQKNDGTARTPGGVLISWYQKYGIDFTDPNVDREDPDNDGFSNIVEFKNDSPGVRQKASDCDGTKSTNPLDPQSHPAYLSRLRLQKYESQPFRMTFRGYEQIGGVETFQIYLADVPSSQQPGLKKTGDKLGFQNYVVGAFHQNIVQKVNATTHSSEEEDDSTLELDRPDIGFSIQLPYRKETDSPDSTANFVMLMPTERDKVVKVQRGQTFTPAFMSTVYLLIDAKADGAVIQDTTTKKNLNILLLDPKEWDEVPASK
jgi:hypothetical protein